MAESDTRSDNARLAKWFDHYLKNVPMTEENSSLHTMIQRAVIALTAIPSERGTSERDVETLRLIERHRIRLQWWPTPDSEMWSADASGNKYVATHRSLHEAVRACVASIPAERTKP